jgi:hypothetical protein
VAPGQQHLGMSHVPGSHFERDQREAFVACKVRRLWQVKHYDQAALARAKSEMTLQGVKLLTIPLASLSFVRLEANCKYAWLPVCDIPRMLPPHMQTFVTLIAIAVERHNSFEEQDSIHRDMICLELSLDTS